jgi:hypothetical protein
LPSTIAIQALPWEKRSERDLFIDWQTGLHHWGKGWVTLFPPQSAGFRLGVSEECLEALHLTLTPTPGLDGSHQILRSFVAQSNLPGALLVLTCYAALPTGCVGRGMFARKLCP